MYAFLTESQFPSRFGPTRSTSEAGNHQRANRKRAARRFLAPGGTRSAAPGGLAQPPDRSGRAKALSGPQHHGEQGYRPQHPPAPARRAADTGLGRCGHAIPPLCHADADADGSSPSREATLSRQRCPGRAGVSPKSTTPALPELPPPPGGNPPAPSPASRSLQARGGHHAAPRSPGPGFTVPAGGNGMLVQSDPAPRSPAAPVRSPRGASAPSHARWPPSRASA